MNNITIICQWCNHIFFPGFKIGHLYEYRPHLSKYDALNNSKVQMVLIILTRSRKRKQSIYLMISTIVVCTLHKKRSLHSSYQVVDEFLSKKYHICAKHRSMTIYMVLHAKVNHKLLVD